MPYSRTMSADNSAPASILSPTLILVVVILVLALLGGLIYLFYNPPVQPTAQIQAPVATLVPSASPTLSPSATQTPTITETPRPTWTLRPTETPTETPTPTQTVTPTIPRVPTLTPARPLRVNDLYRLSTATPELADQIVKLLREIPDNLYPKADQKNTPEYNASFYYPAFAYREALLRYPQASMADSWRWGLAYSWARMGESRALDLYARLIRPALQEDRVKVEDLPVWFHQHEINLTLSVQELPSLQSGSRRMLLEFREGAAFLLLVQNNNEVRFFPLTETFNFASASETRSLLADLDNDGRLDLAIYRPATAGETVLTPPRIFNLAQESPHEITVDPTLPFDFKMPSDRGLVLAHDDLGQSTLELSATFDPACPVRISRYYVWDGKAFIPSQNVVQPMPVKQNLLSCETVLKHSTEFWGPHATIQLLEALLPDWPPSADTKGRPYPADARDDLRYRIGIYDALLGQYDSAVKQLSDLISQPTVPNSSWVPPAQQFLEAYQSPQALYQACITVPACDPVAAIQQLVNASQETDPAKVLELLQQNGVSLRASGPFDFDQDGQVERWFTLRHQPGEKLEFWLLVSGPAGVRALLVSHTEVDKPVPYFSVSPQKPPVFQLMPRQGFVLERLPTTGEPYVIEVKVEPALSTYTRDELLKAEEALLSGTDPARVLGQLEGVLSSGHFNCLNDRICDRFSYVLALAYELTGQEFKARDTYISLWWENSQSPFTIMARLKLTSNP